MMSTHRVVLLAALCGVWPGRAPAQAPAANAFQVGDRILLLVEGDSTLSDTFTVVTGPAVQLPEIGAISLAGVQRTGLEAHLRRELSRYLKDPVVRARALIRLSIQGAVTRPGFYAVPTDLVLADALMVAGGPIQEARVEKMRIQRNGARIWTGPKLQAAIARGATVEDLGLRAGDQIDVPRGRDAESSVRIVGGIATIAIAICVIKGGC